MSTDSNDKEEKRNGGRFFSLSSSEFYFVFQKVWIRYEPRPALSISHRDRRNFLASTHVADRKHSSFASDKDKLYHGSNISTRVFHTSCKKETRDCVFRVRTIRVRTTPFLSVYYERSKNERNGPAMPKKHDSSIRRKDDSRTAMVEKWRAGNSSER